MSEKRPINTAPAQAGAYLVHQARRRARYALVFVVLIAAFCLINLFQNPQALRIPR